MSKVACGSAAAAATDYIYATKSVPPQSRAWCLPDAPHMDTTRASAPGKARATISPDQWEDLRPTIIDLYQSQGRPLYDVCRIMKRDHEFNATSQMYKKRLRKWGVRKNYSQKQKQEILKSGEVRSSLINGRPLIWARLRRSLRQSLRQQGHSVGRDELLGAEECERRRPSRLGGQAKPSTESDYNPIPSQRLTYSSTHCRTSSTFALSKLQLQKNPENYHLEASLSIAAGYFDSLLSQTTTARNLRHDGFTAFVGGLIFQAKETLGTNERRAFQMLSRACDFASPVLAEQPYQLLPSVIHALRPSSWPTHLAVRSRILAYFSAMATRDLGTRHPMSWILRTVCRYDVTEELDRALLKLALDTTDKHTSSLSLTELLEFKMLAVGDLIDAREFVYANKVLEAAFSQAQTYLSGNHSLRLKIMFNRALLECKQGNTSDAESLWTSVVSRGEELQQPGFAYVAADALQRLH